MKNVKVFMAALICLPLFIGCDIIVKKIEIEPNGDIVGTWWCENTKEMYAFKPDGSGIFTDNKSFSRITYLIDGSQVKIYDYGEYLLSIIYNGGDAFVFIFAFERLKRDDIAGIWYNAESEHIFVFKPNGTCSIYDSSNNTGLSDYTVSNDNKKIYIQDLKGIITYGGGDTFDYEGFVFVRQ